MPRPLAQRISHIAIADLSVARATLCLCDPDDPSLSKSGGTVEFAVSGELRAALEKAVADGIAVAEAARAARLQAEQAARDAAERLAAERAADEDARRRVALAALAAEEAGRVERDLAEVAARGGTLARGDEARLREAMAAANAESMEK